MEAKDLIPIVSAVIGLVAAFFTARGAFYTYKAKLAEKAAPQPQSTPVRILALRDRPPTNVNLVVAKVSAYLMIASFLFTGAIMIKFSSDFVQAIPTVLLVTGLPLAIAVFILFTLRGDVSERSSRTKYATTVTVMASYDVVFARCKEIIERLKATIVLVDYDTGLIESQRQSVWHVPFKLKVKADRIGDDRCSVYVESDATVPTALFDFGTNRRRVSRFLRELTA